MLRATLQDETKSLRSRRAILPKYATKSRGPIVVFLVPSQEHSKQKLGGPEGGETVMTPHSSRFRSSPSQAVPVLESGRMRTPTVPLGSDATRDLLTKALDHTA